MRLVISSAWYPVSAATYLLRAARRAGHDVRTVGPTAGDFTPWEGGITFPGQGVRPDLLAPDDFTPEKVCRLAVWSDLWVDVDGGWFLQTRLPAGRRELVATDPHMGDQDPRWTAEPQRPFVDRVWMMQSATCKQGDGWLPWGYDPEWHAPQDEEPDYDATNIGAPYLHRIELTEELERRGVRVLGPGRATMGKEYSRQLCRAPLAIVLPLSDDLPARVFEARACGRCVLTRDVPDLAKTGARDFVFHTSSEGVGEWADFVQALLSPERDRDGWRITPPSWSESHTWDARLAQLVAGRLVP